MSLYHVQSNEEIFFVEAQSYEAALEIWKKHIRKENFRVPFDETDELKGFDEPESIAIVTDQPVLRTAPTKK